jgi:hypothetical protein
MKKLIIPFVIFTFIFSCKEYDQMYSNKDIIFYDDADFKDAKSLKSKNLVSISDSLFSPTETEIIGDYLVLLDRKSKKPFHVVNLLNKEYIGAYGNSGQGPGEVLIPWKISNLNNTLITYDVGGKKILGFDIDSLINNSSSKFEKKINEKGICSSVALVENDIFYTSELESKSRLTKLDTLNGNISTYGSLLYNSRQVADHNLGQACRSNMSSLKDKIVISYILAPYLEIYDIKNDTWKHILTMDNFAPIFTEELVGDYKKFKTKKETRLGFLDISMTDKYIYMLYSGEVMHDHKNDVGNTILVFDYQGNPQTQYKLDKFITTFQVYNDNLIYAINKDVRAELLD